MNGTRRVTRGRESMTRKFVVPPWADRIEVHETDSDLVVTGIGIGWQPLPSEYNIGLDRDLLRGFDAGRRMSRDKSRMAPHLRFAGSKATDQQVEFVREFGPILGTKIAEGVDPYDLIAHQPISILSLEQDLFSHYLELIRGLRKLKDWSRFEPIAIRKYNDYHRSLADGDQSAIDKDLLSKSNSDFDRFLLKAGAFKVELLQEIEKVRQHVASIQELIDSYPENIVWESEGYLAGVPRPFDWKESVGLGSLCNRERLSHELSSNVVLYANLMLCRVFNQVPLTLHYADSIVQDLPEATPYGIRPVLYYMLRMEYLYQREIKICGRPNCGFYFAPDRSDALFCSDLCENADKQRRHRARVKNAD